ncbi:hypothetical protein QJS10_CPA09g00117 [Acorus calamus]|uniref:Uncharacterized protein n=1 Tax=Acorus calamus TaxID=4465 RepID=A0AAV9E557_ACOCL|nr:hypothetical protein QJS10_CPA09g00117 [Acorus calamus]
MNSVGSRPSSNERLVAVALMAATVLSPLCIDRIRAPPEAAETEAQQSISVPPVALVLVIAAGIGAASLANQGCARLDPYWIHRVGGSSFGIAAALAVLALVLKCKASVLSD